MHIQLFAYHLDDGFQLTAVDDDDRCLDRERVAPTTVSFNSRPSMTTTDAKVSKETQQAYKVSTHGRR